MEHGACLRLEMTFPVGGKPSPERTTLGVIPQTLSSLRFEAGFHTGTRGSLICPGWPDGQPASELQGSPCPPFSDSDYESTATPGFYIDAGHEVLDLLPV